jgi:glycosyltransferase involved in cell wall biosynthesis
MTRIALVSPFTFPALCGNSFLADRLRVGLIRRGYAVSLFSSSQDRPDEAASCRPQILHSLNADRPHAWVQEVLRKCSVPWVITLTGTDYTSWCGVNDPPPHIRENLETARALVVFHRDAEESLVRALPSLAGKIAVISQGVAPLAGREDRQALRQAYGFAPDEVVFLMVASIRPVKNIAAAIEAFFEVQSQVEKIRLIFMGPVWDPQEADRVLGRARALRCFTYLGERSAIEVRRIMRAADVFLNTSQSEGMPGAVLEAMAEGLPVLASAVPGNRAVVADGKTGLLFPLESKRHLVDAAVRLARDSRLRERFGNAGQELTQAEHSVERELDRYDTLYRRILSEL